MIRVKSIVVVVANKQIVQAAEVYGPYPYPPPPRSQPPSQSKTEICPCGEAKGQAPAPKVMMPAGGAVQKWGHGHGDIMCGLPTSRTF